MSPKKLLLLTAIVAVLFGFIFLFERKMPTTADRERKGDLYWDLPEDRMERLELVRGGETLSFVKSNAAAWRMVKPLSWPADSFAVNAALGELATLKRSGGDSTEARPADYGLEKPVAKATIGWTDADEPKTKRTRTLEFGIQIPGTDIVAARLEGSSKVLFVPTSTLEAVKKNADDFRGREVFGNSSSDVARLDILRGRGRLALARKDRIWWLTEPRTDLADAAEADRLVAQLTALRVKDFIHDSEDLAAVGLNPPLYRATVSDAKGGAVTVDFGATRSDGNTMYARRDGQTFTVERDIAEELSKEAEPFRSATLAAFDRGDVTGIEGRFPKATYSLAQRDGGWTAGGRPVLSASADDVVAAILAAKSKGFLEEGQIRASGPARATVTVRTKGPTWVLDFFPREGDMVARVSRRPGGFLVDRELPSTLEADFQKLVLPAPTPTVAGKK